MIALFFYRVRCPIEPARRRGARDTGEWRLRSRATERAKPASRSRGWRTNRRLGKAVHARLPTRADGVRCRSRHHHARLVIFLPATLGRRSSFKPCDESALRCLGRSTTTLSLSLSPLFLSHFLRVVLSASPSLSVCSRATFRLSSRVSLRSQEHFFAARTGKASRRFKGQENKKRERSQST